jgi:Fe-S-cluster containining protein
MGSFYKKGLEFECQGCNYCCSCEPGFVFLSEEDLINLCTYFSIDEETFIQTYCREVPIGFGYRVSLLEKDNFDCIFLTEKGCGCYESRPLQCRTYPFWPSIVESETTWNKEAESCPGMNKDKKIKAKNIKKHLDLMNEFVAKIIP